MIPAHGYEAVFKDEDGYEFTKPVVAWSDTGAPLVAGSSHLKRVIDLGGFVRIEERLEPPIVGVLPAGGWRVRWFDEDGSVEDRPIGGWAVYDHGEGAPLDPDNTGHMGTMTPFNTDGRFEIYHPDTRTTDAKNGD